MKITRKQSQHIEWHLLHRHTYAFEYEVWNSKQGLVATVFRWDEKGDPLIWGVRKRKSDDHSYFETEEEALASVGFIESPEEPQP